MSMRRPQSFLFLIPLLIVLLLVPGCLLGQPADNMPAAASTGSLTYYTEDMPPFNYLENGTLRGFSIELLEAITAKMGEKVSRDNVHLVPWSEGYQAALTRNNTVLFAIARQARAGDLLQVGRAYQFGKGGPVCPAGPWDNNPEPCRP